jgi:hypothetical protein
VKRHHPRLDFFGKGVGTLGTSSSSLTESSFRLRNTILLGVGVLLAQGPAKLKHLARVLKFLKIKSPAELLNEFHQEVWQRVEGRPAKQRGSVAGAGVLVGRDPGSGGGSWATRRTRRGGFSRGRWERGA